MTMIMTTTIEMPTILQSLSIITTTVAKKNKNKINYRVIIMIIFLKFIDFAPLFMTVKIISSAVRIVRCQR